MSSVLHPLDFHARQATKAKARDADAEAREQHAEDCEKFLAANFWFANVTPEQVTVDYGRCRELY